MQNGENSLSALKIHKNGLTSEGESAIIKTQKQTPNESQTAKRKENKMYELNYYPSEAGDGIYKMCKTKAQAIKEFVRLEKQYPNRTGDAFIRVWRNYDEPEAEPIKDIDL